VGASPDEGRPLSETTAASPPNFLGRLANTLDAGHSLVTITFCMIMMIGTTSAVRYTFIEVPPDREELLATTLYLAIAWGLIDAGLGLVISVFVQGRARLAARNAGARPAPIRLDREDWMSSLAVIVATLMAALPAVVPFLFPAPVTTLAWISNAIAIAALFWVGWFWARWTDFPRWLCGIALAFVGLLAVAVTVILGIA